MAGVPTVIGYKLDKALKLIGDGQKVIIESTSTPYEDKKKERQGNIPVVVRQKALKEEILLTISYFAKGTIK